MKFLREIGTPNRQIVKSMEEYKTYLNSLNGKVNLYETIYDYKYMKTNFLPDYNSAILDKMFFDADSKNSWRTVKKFHEFLLSKNIKHYIKQSSFMRFHIIVSCDGSNVDNKKGALKNAMNYLTKEAQLSVGDSKECDFDISTFGDLARLCRVPGSYNVNKKSWCNYISSSDLYSEENLKTLSKTLYNQKHYYGEEIFDLTPFDYAVKSNTSSRNYFSDSDSNFSFEFDDSALDNIIKLLPPFIQKVLTNYKDYGNWKNRWRFAIYCRDLGLPMNIADSIAQKYFSKIQRSDYLGNNYKHFQKVKVLDFVYNGVEAYRFPPTGLLIDEGFEITKEDNEKIKELYFLR